MILKQLKETFKIAKKNKNQLLIMLLFDVLFFILTVFSVQHFFDRILTKLIDIVEIIGRENIFAEQTPDLIGAIAQQSLNQGYRELIGLVVALFFSLLAIYIVTQGINWFLSNYILNKKVKFKEYFKRFFLVNIVWAIIKTIILFFALRISFMNVINLGTLINQTFLNIIIVFVLLLLGYFALISYALISKFNVQKALKKSFLLGFENQKELILVYLFFLVTIAADILILRFGITRKSYLISIITILGLLFLMSFNRILINKTVKKLV